MIAVGLLAVGALNKILQALGIFKSKDEKDYEDQTNNPYSFWNPLFWQQGPPGTLGLHLQTCANMVRDINDSFGALDDDEIRIISLFKNNIKTQSQLSFFSWYCNKYFQIDLPKWLIGTNHWPNDHLSAEEFAQITNYVEQLPKYTL